MASVSMTPTLHKLVLFYHFLRSELIYQNYDVGGAIEIYI